MYNFSVPMPLDKQMIKDILDINKEIVKSKITTMYNALPPNCQAATGFEQDRSLQSHDVNNLQDFMELVDVVKENGCDFIYLLNSPKTYTHQDISQMFKKIDFLLDELLAHGCNKVRVTHTLLIDYIYTNYPEIEILCSTSQEYGQLKNYLNLISMFPKIKQIVPSWNMNKDITFINNLQKLCKNQEIEIMLNEGCIAGCPFRTHHNGFLSGSKVKEPLSTAHMFVELCSGLFDENQWENICYSNVIYPWEIDEYTKATGITNYKLVGRNSDSFESGEYVNHYRTYLKGIDDPSSLDDVIFLNLSHYTEAELTSKTITVKEVRPYLPELSFFINKKTSCANECRATCNYCFDKAAILNEKFGKHVLVLNSQIRRPYISPTDKGKPTE